MAWSQAKAGRYRKKLRQQNVLELVEYANRPSYSYAEGRAQDFNFIAHVVNAPTVTPPTAATATQTLCQ